MENRGDSAVLHAELDRLASLGAALQGLANEAARLRTGPSAGPYFSMPGGMEPAVLEACAIAHDLVDTALVSAVKDRLSQTGRIMADVANQYRNADESGTSLSTVMATYTDATGTWDVPEVPQ
jgi:hypothetical protein